MSDNIIQNLQNQIDTLKEDQLRTSDQLLVSDILIRVLIRKLGSKGILQTGDFRKELMMQADWLDEHVLEHLGDQLVQAEREIDDMLQSETKAK